MLGSTSAPSSWFLTVSDPSLPHAEPQSSVCTWYIQMYFGLGARLADCSLSLNESGNSCFDPCDIADCNFAVALLSSLL